MKYFFIIGAKKSGTTYIHEQLRLVPKLFVPPIKETHFLLPMFRKRYLKYLNNYNKTFPTHKNELDQNFFIKFLKKNIIVDVKSYLNLLNSKMEFNGECDPELMLLNEVSIRELSKSDCKIICILRDPVDRFFSHVKMTLNLNQDPNVFIDKNFNSLQHQINHSSYSVFLTNWLKYFSLDRFLFIRSSDLRSKKLQSINKILSFIQGDRFLPLNNSDMIQNEINVGSDWKINNELNAKLRLYFKKELEFFESVKYVRI